MPVDILWFINRAYCRLIARDSVYGKGIVRRKLLKTIPDLFDYHSVLYIGARASHFSFGLDFQKSGYEITVVEVFEKNAAYLRSLPWVHAIIEDDIRRVQLHRRYDVIFWWHGPEHVLESEASLVLRALPSFANEIVVVGCPLGYYEQGPIDGNTWEIHSSHLSRQFFLELGYQCSTVGPAHRGGNITAWWRKNAEAAHTLIY